MYHYHPKLQKKQWLQAIKFMQVHNRESWPGILSLIVLPFLPSRSFFKDRASIHYQAMSYDFSQTSCYEAADRLGLHPRTSNTAGWMAGEWKILQHNVLRTEKQRNGWQSFAGLCAMLNTSTLSLDQTHNEKIDVAIFFFFFFLNQKRKMFSNCGNMHP